MFDESRLQFAVRGALIRTTVPPIDLAEIRRRRSVKREERHAGRRRRYAGIAAAAAAVVVASALLAARAPALVQSLEERYRAALIAAGIGSGAPAPMPESMRKAIIQSEVSLSQAQQRANFVIVSPVDLPHDVVRGKILVAPLAVWLKQTKAWSFDGLQVTFSYVRKDGRAFDIIADRYSTLNGPEPRYLYDSDSAGGVSANGRPIIKRYENFVWRNGDQELRAVADSTISAREIESMRIAMHGVLLPTVDSQKIGATAGRVVFYSMP
jgi:hypothetical protein